MILPPGGIGAAGGDMAARLGEPPRCLDPPPDARAGLRRALPDRLQQVVDRRGRELVDRERPDWLAVAARPGGGEPLVKVTGAAPFVLVTLDVAIDDLAEGGSGGRPRALWQCAGRACRRSGRPRSRPLRVSARTGPAPDRARPQGRARARVRSDGRPGGTCTSSSAPFPSAPRGKARCRRRGDGPGS
jgi:hypothetical protein